ncbi:hypothetical protein KKH23_08520 [Patescibacteria group bacterium]|nr:hypothetical protein [Patescibacteria group bacterium]
MALPYDRTRYYMEMGDFVKIVGLKGESAFFRIALLETMAQQQVLVADAVQGVDIPGTATDPSPVDFKFNEPVQELRLIQIRPTIYPVTFIAGLQPVPANIPPTINVQWSSPISERRGGTDRVKTVTMNGIANVVGGPEGGAMPANQIRGMPNQDPNEVFDLFFIHGYRPGFNVFNGSPVPMGGGGGLAWDFSWYLPCEGRRYVLAKPTVDELKGLFSRKIPYRTVCIGGIDSVDMEA